MTEEQEFERVWRIHNVTNEILEPLGLKVLERQNNNDRVDNILKKLVNRIREQTIQECLECVPENLDITDTRLADMHSRHMAELYNLCREQTINNINNLSKQ